MRDRDKPKRRKLSISLGTSIFYKANGAIDVESIRATSNELRRLTREGSDIALVVGAGPLGSHYIKVAKQFSKNNKRLNQIESEASMINAKLFIESLRVLKVRTFPEPASTLDKVVEFLSEPRRDDNDGSIIVTGIFDSGKNSEECAAEIAKGLGGQLISISNIKELRNL